MATIDSNGVLFYQDSDNFTPPASLNLAQSNLSDLLSAGVRFKRVANTTARSTLVASVGIANISKANPLIVWRADAADGVQLEYTTNGTTWHTYYDGRTSTQTLAQNSDTRLTMSVAGRVVTISAEGSFSLPARFYGALGAINVVPANLRPAKYQVGTLMFQWSHTGTLTVNEVGTVFAWNPAGSASPASWFGSVTYVAG